MCWPLVVKDINNMKIAQEAFEQYRDIDPREIDIKMVTKRIDLQYVPLLWVFFFCGAVVAIATVILLFIVTI